MADDFLRILENSEKSEPLINSALNAAKSTMEQAIHRWLQVFSVAPFLFPGDQPYEHFEYHSDALIKDLNNRDLLIARYQELKKPREEKKPIGGKRIRPFTLREALWENWIHEAKIKSTRDLVLTVAKQQKAPDEEDEYKKINAWLSGDTRKRPSDKILQECFFYLNEKGVLDASLETLKAFEAMPHDKQMEVRNAYIPIRIKGVMMDCIRAAGIVKMLSIFIPDFKIEVGNALYYISRGIVTPSISADIWMLALGYTDNNNEYFREWHDLTLSEFMKPIPANTPIWKAGY